MIQRQNCWDSHGRRVECPSQHIKPESFFRNNDSRCRFYIKHRPQATLAPGSSASLAEHSFFSFSLTAKQHRVLPTDSVGCVRLLPWNGTRKLVIWTSEHRVHKTLGVRANRRHGNTAARQRRHGRLNFLIVLLFRKTQLLQFLITLASRSR